MYKLSKEDIAKIGEIALNTPYNESYDEWKLQFLKNVEYHFEISII